MSENVDLKEISSVNVRNDANALQLTFVGADGKSLTVTASMLQMDYLFRELTKISSAVTTTRALALDEPPEHPKEFSPMPETHLALDSEFVLSSLGGLDLRVQTQDGVSLQLSLLPEHVQLLRGLLAD